MGQCHKKKITFYHMRYYFGANWPQTGLILFWSCSSFLRCFKLSPCSFTKLIIKKLAKCFLNVVKSYIVSRRKTLNWYYIWTSRNKLYKPSQRKNYNIKIVNPFCVHCINLQQQYPVYDMPYFFATLSVYVEIREYLQ